MQVRQLALLLLLLAASPRCLAETPAQGEAPQQQPATATMVPIGYLKQEVKKVIPLSRLKVEPEDIGIAGAEIALTDNNTTGRFTKQQFTLEVERVPVGGDAVEALEKLVQRGHHYIVVDAPAETLLRLSDAVKGKDVLLFNVRASDENLREKDCRANVLHTAPDRAMLADALAQYLVWKRWQRWLVVKGVFPEDLAYLDMVRRSAKRFGATIVEEREYKETPGARRSDSGEQQIQQQMPVFTQGAPSYDVVVVADERDVFGSYLPYRTWDPRPVAGSAGLMPTSWDAAQDQWGAIQMQNRFFKLNSRRMTARDMQAWTAARMIGEAASRTNSGDPKPVFDFLKSADFSIAAFKGQRLTLRDWNLQLRQPILLVDGRMVVSVSPQEGFLHQYSELDTLGIDRPETKCKLSG